MPTCMCGQSGFLNKRVERAQKSTSCEALAPQELYIPFPFYDFMSDSDEKHILPL